MMFSPPSFLSQVWSKGKILGEGLKSCVFHNISTKTCKACALSSGSQEKLLQEESLHFSNDTSPPHPTFSVDS